MKTKLTGIKKKDKSRIEEEIFKANEIQVDSLWAILKYKDIGILRKLKCMSNILNISPKEVLQGIPQDENGRFLDKPTRNLIHQALINKQEELNNTYEKK
jgi:hypothetical protein